MEWQGYCSILMGLFLLPNLTTAFLVNIIAPWFNRFNFIGLGAVSVVWFCISWLSKFSSNSRILFLISEPHLLSSKPFLSVDLVASVFLCLAPRYFITLSELLLYPENKEPRSEGPARGILEVSWVLKIHPSFAWFGFFQTDPAKLLTLSFNS